MSVLNTLEDRGLQRFFFILLILAMLAMKQFSLKVELLILDQVQSPGQSKHITFFRPSAIPGYNQIHVKIHTKVKVNL